MTKEEIIKNLSDCYALKSNLVHRNLSVPEDLENEILHYESQFHRLTYRTYHYHKIVDANDEAFYQSLVKYTRQETDQQMLLQVGDGCTSAVIIKRGDKYGLFLISGSSSDWDDPEFLSLPNPFIYEDVRFARDFSFKNDIGLVAVKKDGLWGVVDMNREHCYQIIVDVEEQNYYNLKGKAEDKIGMFIDGAWEEFRNKA